MNVKLVRNLRKVGSASTPNGAYPPLTIRARRRDRGAAGYVAHQVGNGLRSPHGAEYVLGAHGDQPGQAAEDGRRPYRFAGPGGDRYRPRQVRADAGQGTTSGLPTRRGVRTRCFGASCRHISLRPPPSRRFTETPSSTGVTASGCRTRAIEHRLAPPRRPRSRVAASPAAVKIQRELGDLIDGIQIVVENQPRHPAVGRPNRLLDDERPATR